MKPRMVMKIVGASLSWLHVCLSAGSAGWHDLSVAVATEKAVE